LASIPFGEDAALPAPLSRVVHDKSLKLQPVGCPWGSAFANVCLTRAVQHRHHRDMAQPMWSIIHDRAREHMLAKTNADAMLDRVHHAACGEVFDRRVL
jgi:hypothetical protein